MSKLEFISGSGVVDPNQKGVFEVRASTTKKFDKLSEALEYYDSLHEDKALWDLTTIAELLESHRIVS